MPVHCPAVFLQRGVVWGYTVPVTVSVATPGVIIHAPVSASCVKVAAGTVITPGTVAKSPSVIA